MNKNELQVLIDYTKGMIADNKEPEKKSLLHCVMSWNH